jgi:hypothetical protein
MNGDLRLRRRRWWGAWAILAMAAFCLLLFVSDAVDAKSWSSLQACKSTAIPIAITLLISLVCYAPWTFFWLLRVMGALVVVGYIVYVFDEARQGHWFSEGHSNTSVFDALRGMLFFGVPGAILALARRPSVCPYDERGRLVSIEVWRTLRLHRPPYVNRSVWEPELRKQLSIVVLPRRIRERTEVGPWSEEPELRVRLPLGTEGENVFALLRTRLEERQIAFDVRGDEPAPITFRTYFESVLSSWRFGGL